MRQPYNESKEIEAFHTGSQMIKMLLGLLLATFYVNLTPIDIEIY
jgi:hypothetical protein